MGCSPSQTSGTNSVGDTSNRTPSERRHGPNETNRIADRNMVPRNGHDDETVSIVPTHQSTEATAVITSQDAAPLGGSPVIAHHSQERAISPGERKAEVPVSPAQPVPLPSPPPMPLPTFASPNRGAEMPIFTESVNATSRESFDQEAMLFKVIVDQNLKASTNGSTAGGSRLPPPPGTGLGSTIDDPDASSSGINPLPGSNQRPRGEMQNPWSSSTTAVAAGHNHPQQSIGSADSIGQNSQVGSHGSSASVSGSASTGNSSVDTRYATKGELEYYHLPKTACGEASGANEHEQ